MNIRNLVAAEYILPATIAFGVLLNYAIPSSEIRQVTITDVTEMRRTDDDGIERRVGIIKARDSNGNEKVYKTLGEIVKCPLGIFNSLLLDCEVPKNSLYGKLEDARTLSHPVYVDIDTIHDLIFNVEEER